MPLSDAFARTYGVITGAGADSARTQLMAAELAMRSKLEMAAESRAAAMFPLQYAAAGRDLENAGLRNEDLRRQLTLNTKLDPMRVQQQALETENYGIANTMNKLQLRLAKLQGTESMQGAEVRRLTGLAGLANIKSEIDFRDAEAARNKAEADNIQDQIDALKSIANDEKAENANVRDAVGGQLDTMGDRIGKRLPTWLYKFYEGKMKSALATGKYDIDQLSDMLGTELSNKLSSTLTAQKTLSDFVMAHPAFGGVPRPAPGGDPISAMFPQQPAMPAALPASFGNLRGQRIGLITNMLKNLGTSEKSYHKSLLSGIVRPTFEEFGVRSLNDLYKLDDRKLQNLVVTLSDPISVSEELQDPGSGLRSLGEAGMSMLKAAPYMIPVGSGAAALGGALGDLGLGAATAAEALPLGPPNIDAIAAQMRAASWYGGY